MEVRGQDAFDAFVRARYVELLRFGRALTGGTEDGADLLHDALASTLLAWRRVESQGDPEGYVRRVMVNRNISLWRRRRRERDHLATMQPPPGQDDETWSLSVWAAVRALPARQRTVVALRFYADLSVAEVAAHMGCSEGTVKSQTAKAVTKLRALVGSLDDLARTQARQEVSGGPVHE
ncbi:MAG: SigE family RNA polymerase sigma factor [Nocardioidaceae bacterium]